MTHRERFRKVYSFEPVDRLPLYFFGSWTETKQRWKAEGLEGDFEIYTDKGPQLAGMDPDWEPGLWDVHDLVRIYGIADEPSEVIAETDSTRTIRTPFGEEYVERTDGSSIRHTLKYPLEATKESWKRMAGFFEHTADRYAAGWEDKARAMNEEDRVKTFMGGSLYGWIRDWMGVEGISYLMYDEPELFEEMVSFLTEHFITLMAPILKKTQFDFVYFFEDCCGVNGPLFSPDIYKEILDKYYKKLIRFYKDNGVPFALVDSDGVQGPLVPCWVESGFDIVFPLEVGTWGGNPRDLRQKYGRRLGIMGGVNKHLIAGDEAALRAHLLDLKPEADKGGYLPIPDHRVPPEVSLEDMYRYIRVYKEVFGG